jgi:hypothetical protein
VNKLLDVVQGYGVIIMSILNPIEIVRASINRIEDLQNWMFKNLLAVPHCVPTPSLRYELGCLSMEERINSQKLNLLFHIRNLDSSSLAKEIYEIQRDLNYPGLVKECRSLIIKYDLPNIIDNATNMTKLGWKNLVKRNITNHAEDNLKGQFQHYSKLKDGPLMEANFEIQPYVKTMKLRNARTMFRIRTMMTPAKFNRKSDPTYSSELWKCDSCQKIDSQSHILWCPQFSSLREGKNIMDDDDLVQYIQKVFKIREDMEDN